MSLAPHAPVEGLRRPVEVPPDQGPESVSRPARS